MVLLAAVPVTIRAATPEQEGLGVQSVTRAARIPFELGPREMAVNEPAGSKEPQSFHLASIGVLSLRDRTVKLRFAMAGVALPPFATTCAPGQALVSVRVDVLSVPRH
jgi:hypothetical protein